MYKAKGIRCVMLAGVLNQVPAASYHVQIVQACKNTKSQAHLSTSFSCPPKAATVRMEEITSSATPPAQA